MIYILTLNPSIDYYMKADDVQFGKTNRSNQEYMRIGGKGINVGIVLNSFGVHCTISGFVGGFTGDYIRQELQDYPYIHQNLIDIGQPTRINVKMFGEYETEVNSAGHEVPPSSIQELEEHIASFTKDDLVVVTGSLPKGMGYGWYTKCVKMLSEKHIPFIVDIADTEIHKIIKYKPLLIKPNKAEFENYTGKRYKTLQPLIVDAKKLLEKGPKYIIISLGEMGSIFVSKDACYRAFNPEGMLHSSVGSGDSMVAGFIAGTVRGLTIDDVYRYACAAGCACAYSVGLATQEGVVRYCPEIYIEEIDEFSNCELDLI